MNCEDARALLNPYVDGELPVVENIEIEKHLKHCAACASSVENHRELHAALQDPSLYYTAPSLDRLLPRRSNWNRRLSIAALAAALLIAGFVAGRFMPEHEPTEQAVLDSHLRSLMPGRLADVESTDQHTVKPWFNGKLDFSPPVADFAQQGFPLTGGRVDSIDGRAVAALVYRRNKHVINVYVWPAPGSGRIETSERQGYNEDHWTQAGFEWWAISDLNAAELKGFAALLRGEAR